jgi:hypothetical protein
MESKRGQNEIEYFDRRRKIIENPAGQAWLIGSCDFLIGILDDVIDIGKTPNYQA